MGKNKYTAHDAAILFKVRDMMKPKKPIIKLLRSASYESELGLVTNPPVYISDADVCELSAMAMETNPVVSATESTGCVTSPDPNEVSRALNSDKV